MDTGRTAQRLTGAMLTDGAASVRLATLLDKPARRVVDVIPDYVGFEASAPPQLWLLSDMAESYRTGTEPVMQHRHHCFRAWLLR